nr:autoinducer binding domain-containing protein [Aurantimonas aggregata]
MIYLSVTPSTASMATTLPEAWTSHYRDSGYEQIDPFLSYCCATLTPIGTGSDYCPDYDYLSGRQQQLIHEAAEFG